MFTAEQIQSLFGQPVITYLQNKNRGGINGEKGSTYENFYALYQLAVLAQDVIEYNRDATLYGQAFAFVDDLMVDRHEDPVLQNYQLKNSAKVAWGKGNKSIQNDFHKQKILNDSISRESQIYLVVSDRNLQNKLSAKCPIAIRDFSQVLYFPYEKGVGRLLENYPDLKDAIKYLCAFEDPEIDKIECVANVLLGAIVSCAREHLSVREILEKARAFSPSYIRSLSGESSLDPQVVEILSNINNFSCNTDRGFLHWDYGDGILTGTVSHSIDSEQFEKIQRLVKNANPTPTTFAEIQDFLL
jgi:hypothetical protein